jgi:hypothetical protein
VIYILFLIDPPALTKHSNYPFLRMCGENRMNRSIPEVFYRTKFSVAESIHQLIAISHQGREDTRHGCQTNDCTGRQSPPVRFQKLESPVVGITGNLVFWSGICQGLYTIFIMWWG